jgi:ATP-dependent Clp protease ATP-binding subunit ClpC
MGEVVQIVDLMIRRLADQLDSQGIGIELTRAAKELVAGRGYEPNLGARPLRRAIQQLIEDPLSEKILWKEFRVGETIIVDAEDGVISFKAVDGIAPPPVELAGAGADS